MWDVGGSILVNVQKRSKKTSNSSRLGTSTWAIAKGCVLGRESLPDMVTVSLCPWNRILSTSFALRTSKEGGINVEKCGTLSLEDEPFLLPIFCFFAEGPTLLTLFNLFCCHSRKSACRLATVSFFLHLFNNRWHDQLNSLVLLYSLCSEYLVQIDYRLLSLMTNDSILLCRLRGRVWNYPGSWSRGLAQSPFLMFFLPNV